MASKTVTRYYANAAPRTFARPPQGRRKSALPLRGAGVLVHLTQKDKAEWSEFCRNAGMSESAMGGLAMREYMRLSVTDNC